MDLIYTDSSGEDTGVLAAVSYDSEMGESTENNFECKVSRQNHCCDYGSLIYFEEISEDGKVNGTEYGGRVDDIKIDTSANTITYSGRNWYGFLADKIITPPSGSEHLILSGDANACLNTILNNVSLTDLFSVSEEESGFELSSYQMDRYVTALYGINKMLKSVGARLNMQFNGSNVILSAVVIHDYSQDDEWDSDQFTYTAKKSEHFLNHVIGGGSGEGTERIIGHWYQDGDGNISQTVQTFTGSDEIVQFYDSSTSASVEEMDEGARKLLTDAYSAANTVDGNFTSTQVYAIGDLVGVSDQDTGITLSEAITSKIIKVEGSSLSITCKVGG